MPIQGVSLFLILMAAGTIQGQTMQGQQRTRNFFPIQVFASFYFHKNLIHAGGQRVMEP